MKWALLATGILLLPTVCAQSPIAANGEAAVVPDRVLKPLSEGLLARYFSRKPKKFLVDPQHLLNSREFSERNDFLNYHSSDSTIDLWFYLFDENQEIPPSAKFDDIARRHFAKGKPSAIIFYFLGDPERSSLLLSPSLVDVVSLSEQERAIESSVGQAGKDSIVSKQLERFMLQMSIQIYWMEELLESGPADESGVVKVGGEQSELAASQELGQLERVWLELGPYLWYIVISVLVIVAVLLLRVIITLRAVYRFPEIEVETRLGGAHAAGVGAVISFASASVSPAAQRNMAPEYLKRL